MIKISSMPATHAEPIDRIWPLTDNVIYTSYGSLHEKKICDELNKRLNIIENSLDINKEELNSIQEVAEQILLSLDEQHQYQLRVKYLERLYQAKEAINSHSINTKEEAEQLRTRIAPAKIGSLKNEIRTKLDLLIKSLPSEQIEEIKLSPELELLIKAKEVIGKPFINLGKTGQEFIVKEVLDVHGEKAAIEVIRKHLREVEQALENITAIKDTRELISRLENLPFSTFSTFSSKRKEQIAERLMEMSSWNSFVSLNRIINLLDKQIMMEEPKQAKTKTQIQINEGKLAFSLDISNMDRIHLVRQ